MDRWICGVLAALFFGSASPAVSQSGVPLALQLGTAIQVPLGDFGDLVDNGYGLSLGTGFQFAPDIAAYAAYSWSRFPSEALGGDVTDSGFTIGVSGVLSSSGLPIHPWAGAGILVHRLRIADVDEQPDQASPGFTLGGGALVPITDAVHLAPSVAYSRYGTPLPGREETAVSHVRVGVAVNVRL
jgi:opacity protein-like surface antigen